jgi:hypothetical protein
MLILRRKEGQWVEITHRSGDTIRVRVANIRSRFRGQLDLVFDDDERNFQVQRPERGSREEVVATVPLGVVLEATAS